MTQQHIICFGYAHNARVCERERTVVHPFDAISRVLLNAKVGQFEKKHQGDLLPAPFLCNFCVSKMLNPSFTGVYVLRIIMHKNLMLGQQYL